MPPRWISEAAWPVTSPVKQVPLARNLTPMATNVGS